MGVLKVLVFSLRSRDHFDGFSYGCGTASNHSLAVVMLNFNYVPATSQITGWESDLQNRSIALGNRSFIFLIFNLHFNDKKMIVMISIIIKPEGLRSLVILVYNMTETESPGPD